MLTGVDHALEAASKRTYGSWLRFAVFKPDECAQIIDGALKLPLETARVESGLRGVREGQVAWLERSSTFGWVFDRLEALAREYADEMAIDIDELCDWMQFVKYEPGGRFDWHIDVGPGRGLRRKVTVCAQLTDATAYDGGMLELVGEQSVLWRRAIGSATVFPSILGHRLTPVTRGTRYALVAWMLGPPYR